MKRILLMAAVLLAMMIALPVAALGFHPVTGTETQGAQEPEDPAKTETPAVEIVPNTAAAAAKKESIPVLRTATGRVETIGLEEYLRGCVAGELLMTDHVEALKAQAVASCTYARYRLAQGKDAVSDSGETDQAYLSPEERKRRWGDNAEAYERKLADAVAAVLGQQVTREGKPILAVVHALNGGKTENAADYWGGDYPYLVSTDSPGDRLSPDYAKVQTFSTAEMRAALGEDDGLKPGNDPAAWFGKSESTPVGTVQSIELCGKARTGREIRALLELRSANFSVTFKEGVFSIKTVGWGHGVGMSQYGADFMARQGSDYKEILEYYYAGCTVA
ncbi:MAG: stage II sporulation protein D [Oscillospiraceae bacterium]|nr:stage II sporulation protein D [Oscillospiraceae bacterium]